MKINWKEVAASEGYKTLKAAYIEQVARAHKDKSCHGKPEYLKLFNKVICRAKNHAYHQNKSLIEVLDEWERERLQGKWPQSFDNHYRNYLKKKLNTPEPKAVSMGVRGLIKYYKRSWGNDPVGRKQRVSVAIRNSLPKPKRVHPKARWDALDRRIREYRLKKGGS